MKALVLSQPNEPLCFVDQSSPAPSRGQVLVKLKAAALNRRDYWITQGLYPGIQCPVILGSDGAGVVTAVGEGVDPAWLGRAVIINPGYDWGDDPSAQGGRFRILGMPDNGTFAEFIAAPVGQVYPKPPSLTWEQAGALPLAAMTAFRALMRQGRLQSGQTVLITGIGGGVATYALQLAVAAGAKVLVTSSSPGKLEKAAAMGAFGGLLYTQPDWSEGVVSEFGPVDVAIDGAGGEGYAKLIDVVRPGGRIVNYGATRGAPSGLELRKVFWKQLHLVGSTMGCPADFAGMLEAVSRYGIVPVVDSILPLAQGNAALERMRACGQFGKLVLHMGD